MNTETDSKRLMLHWLCKALDKDRPDWRETSMCIMDNAPYNRDELTEEFIKKQKMPMISRQNTVAVAPRANSFSLTSREILSLIQPPRQVRSKYHLSTNFPKDF